MKKAKSEIQKPSPGISQSDEKIKIFKSKKAQGKLKFMIKSVIKRNKEIKLKQ